MGVYVIKTYCYQLIVGLICVLFGWHALKQKDVRKQLMSSIVLIPFLLRFFLIK